MHLQSRSKPHKSAPSFQLGRKISIMNKLVTYFPVTPAARSYSFWTPDLGIVVKTIPVF
jgi:hypothetical protein